MLIWGTGELAEINFIFFSKVKQNIEIVAFVDSNKNKWGTEFNGINIISPQRVIEQKFDYIDIWSEKYYDEIKNQLCIELKVPESKIRDAFSEIRDKLFNRYKNTEDIEIKQYISNMKNKKWISIYSFDFCEKHGLREVFKDSEDDLPYILFEGKRMYLTRDYKFITQDGMKYTGDFWGEQDSESPHLYMNGDVKVHDGDVLIDAGACEGNFSLHNIEKVSKLYIVESETKWIEALRRTFEPWKEKVVICQGFLGNKDSDTVVCIDSLVRNDKVDFIKMDIEGSEISALLGAKKTLQKNENMRCAICSYHKHDDEHNIKAILEEAGFVTETSKGYMWFFLEEFAAEYCELRHGIVRGIKNKISCNMYDNKEFLTN